MLSKQERHYLMFEKEFEDRYGKNYCKKIRNSIRKKILQIAIDIFYISEFENRYFKYKGDKPLNHRKNLNLFTLFCVAHDLNRYYERAEPSEKNMNSALKMLYYGLAKSRYKKFVMDTKLKEKINEALKKNEKEK